MLGTVDALVDIAAGLMPFTHDMLAAGTPGDFVRPDDFSDATLACANAIRAQSSRTLRCTWITERGVAGTYNAPAKRTFGKTYHTRPIFRLITQTILRRAGRTMARDA